MIVSRWTGTEVRALREVALRMTQEQLAAASGFKPPTVRKWERATAARPVRGESAEALDTLLGRLDDAQRARFRDALAIEPIAKAATTDAGFVPAVRDSLAIGGSECSEVDDEVKRREFGILLGATLLATGSRSIGVTDAQRVSRAVATFAEQDQNVGGATLVDTAVRELEVAKELIETCSFSDNAGKAFASAAGNLATIAGWLAYDADQHQLARHCYTDAFSLANQAGDDELTVHVCLGAAHQAITLSRQGFGNPHRALTLISRARELTHGLPPGRIHALIATRAAQAYGVLGDRANFSRCIATAWRELDFALEHEPLTECAKWLHFVNSTEVRCHEARAYGDLGNWSKAAELSGELAIEKAGTRNAVNYRAGWAAALAQAGDALGAVSIGLPALEQLQAVSSTRTLRVLEPVRSAVQPDSAFGLQFDDLTKKAARA
ncbi:helix-turn-helix domain-containing protein [Nocardia tengchongensis]|uniref:helix-turn-helix domain-containing protein n=1 Tax=Nocardia tengchongensis TaxID=2055889 RepID=UPI0036C05584